MIIFPPGMDMLLLASPGYLSEVSVKDIVCLSMPLKVQELVSTVDMMCQSRERRRRRQRLAPRERSKEEAAIIKEAKALLMERNRMTEEEAHSTYKSAVWTAAQIWQRWHRWC